MHELLPQIIFYVFAALTIVSALMVVTQNNPVRCVLFLVLAFFCSAVLWILAQAEFLALILVLVYVGAVMTLFLFIVMMLDIDIESMKKHFIRYLPLGLVIIVLLSTLLYIAIPKGSFTTSESPVVAVKQVITKDFVADEETTSIQKPLSNTEALGMVLYTDYVFAFELAAAILLVAIIAAVTLVHRNPARSKRQNIVQQVMVRRDDRVKLVKMKSENNEKQ